jgi:hypothetical protein
MKFQPANRDDVRGLDSVRISEGGLVFVGVFGVLYGSRIRAGFCADRIGCTIDWCAGDNPVDVCNLYYALLDILSAREEDGDCFDGLPTHSEIKPVWKDEKFLAKIEAELALVQQ